jgi:poly(3-hydroxybutyrate) depolymerase
VTNTGYDQAGAILTQIYGGLNPPSAAPAGQLIAFDQTPFGGVALGPTGFVYVPSSCARGGCRIHVAFHGCKQTPEDIGDQYYSDTGYNRWADTNNIVVLYPQVSATFAKNPEHCWDWWGYTGAQFSVQASPQMSAVKQMIDQLTR